MAWPKVTISAAEVKRHLCATKQKTGDTEQVDLEATLYRLAFCSCLVRILAGTQTVLTGFSWLLSVPPGKFRIVPRLGHDRILPDPFQFIIHYLCHHYSTPYSSDAESVVE
jgi:hypothetical protein